MICVPIAGMAIAVGGALAIRCALAMAGRAVGTFVMVALANGCPR
jgi:hypothetical protein